MNGLAARFLKTFDLQIGDEHMPGRVSHHQRDPAGSGHLLRSYTAGPEHWDFIISDLDGVSVFGELKIENPKLLGGTNMNRFSMSKIKWTCKVNRPIKVERRNGSHGYNKISREWPERLQNPIRIIHGDVTPLSEMSNGDASFCQHNIKREATSQQECHPIVLPHLLEIHDLLNQLACFKDVVLGEIGSKIRCRRKASGDERSRSRSLK